MLQQITDKQKADRLAFAKNCQAWSLSNWMFNVIWTDDSSFEVGKNSRQVKVWWQPYEHYLSNCIASTFKSRRISIMIWGVFIGYEKCPIVIIPSDRRAIADFIDIVCKG